mgnify:CR=1 FL=1
MVLKHYYYYFTKALSSKFCNEVIQYALSKQEKIGLTGTFGGKDNLSEDDLKTLYKKRNSNITWLNDPWIYKEIVPYIKEANQKAGWNFQLDFAEDLQFTKYNTNQHYGWHQDCDIRTEGKKIRKISVTCHLTDGSEYTGGELEFDYRNYDPDGRDSKNHVVSVKEIVPQGSIAVFPSFIWHRITPVTRGTRYSLVGWNMGNNYA